MNIESQKRSQQIKKHTKNDAFLLPADITIKHHKASKFVCVMPTLAAMMLLKELPMVKEMLVAIVKKEYTLMENEKERAREQRR